MNIGIIYFSGTGNTQWVVNYIYDKVSKMETQSEMFNIAESDKTDFTEYDNILLAHPVYGANIPPIVLRKIRGYRFNENVKISILATYGYVNALGIFKEAEELGFKIHSYINIKMFNNISTPGLKSKILPLGKREKLRKRTENKIDRKVLKLVNGQRIIDGVGPYLVAGKFIKNITKDKIYDNYRRLSVDKNICSDCFTCINNCPANAIEKVNEEYIFNNSCTACMRCYNNCPAAAVIIDRVFADPKVYKRYKGPWK